MKRLEGTAVEELVRGGKLNQTDILLSHSRGNLWGWVVRLGTRNYWNHASMVYPAKDEQKTTVIEARGYVVGIHDITEYLENPARYDVAVKRLETGWFQDAPEACGSYRESVCEFASRRIDDPSESRLWRTVIRKTVRPFRVGRRFLFHRRKVRDETKAVKRVNKLLRTHAFSCSGFIQWAYYQGVAEVCSELGLDDAKLREVVFNPRSPEEITEYDLLTTTPADLARSRKLSWKYVVRDGVVWEVSGADEADRLVG